LSLRDLFSQMDDTIDYLRDNNVRLLKKGEIRDAHNSTLGATVGMLWMDVEGTQVYTALHCSSFFAQSRRAVTNW
jgi:hypothetical protein